MTPHRATPDHASDPVDHADGPVTRTGPSARVRPIRLALVNDYEIIVRGLHAMLAPFVDRIHVVEHDIGTEPERRVDVALFDTFAAHRDSIRRSAVMASEGKADHIVLYTWEASPAFLDASREAGVSAVLRKSLTGAHLVDALAGIVDGREVPADELSGSTDGDDTQPLTLREREVLALIALGMTNAEIAEELFVSIDTVKTHAQRLFRKLDVQNRTQAAMLARDHQLAPPPARVARWSDSRSA